MDQEKSEKSYLEDSLALKMQGSWSAFELQKEPLGKSLKASETEAKDEEAESGKEALHELKQKSYQTGDNNNNNNGNKDKDGLFGKSGDDENQGKSSSLGNSLLLEKKLETRDTNSMDEYSELGKSTKSKDEQIVRNKTHIFVKQK